MQKSYIAKPRICIWCGNEITEVIFVTRVIQTRDCDFLALYHLDCFTEAKNEDKGIELVLQS
jgi:hypothetical protein